MNVYARATRKAKRESVKLLDKIERLIVENGGHFVLQVKKNNPILYEEIITSFAAFEQELELKPEERTKRLKQYIEKYDKWYRMEKNRERIEYRDVKVYTDATFLECMRQEEISFMNPGLFGFSIVLCIIV